MRKSLYALGIALGALLAGPMAAAAATASAQIVACPTATACYSPNPIRISVGSSVAWTNNHTLAHTATADSGAWDSGTIAPGATSSAITFNTPGTFAYHCNFHANMHGTVIVSAAATATPAASARPTTSTRALAQSGGGIASVPVETVLAVAGLVLLAIGGLWLRDGARSR